MRTYLVFGDIEGKLDVLNGECSAAPSSPAPVANRITATESPTKKA
jgi:hypothetical protein